MVFCWDGNLKTKLLDIFQRLHFSAKVKKHQIASNDTSKSVSISLFYSAIRASKRALPTQSSRWICATSSMSQRKAGKRDMSCASRCLEAKLSFWLFRVKSRPSGGSRYLYSPYQRAGVETDKSGGRHGGILLSGEHKVFFFWNQVVQDVGSQSSNTEGLDGSASPIIQRKLELDKVCVCVCECVSACVFECLPVYLQYFLWVFACVCHKICP